MYFQTHHGSIHWSDLRAHIARTAGAGHAASVQNVAVPAAQHYCAYRLGVYLCDHTVAGGGSWARHPCPRRSLFPGLVLVYRAVAVRSCCPNHGLMIEREIMFRQLTFGSILLFLGLSASAMAQSTRQQPPPAKIFLREHWTIESSSQVKEKGDVLSQRVV